MVKAPYCHAFTLTQLSLPIRSSGLVDAALQRILGKAPLRNHTAPPQILNAGEKQSLAPRSELVGVGSKSLRG